MTSSYPSVTWCQRLNRSSDFMEYDVGGVLCSKIVQLSASILKIGQVTVVA